MKKILENSQNTIKSDKLFDSLGSIYLILRMIAFWKQKYIYSKIYLKLNLNMCKLNKYKCYWNYANLQPVFWSNCLLILLLC